MGISTVQIVLLVIFGCIAGMGSVLDSFQTHRPLIACTVVGLILGDVKTGILLGGTLEMIALGWMNIGAAQSPDSALASIISTILVVVGHQSVANGIAIALPVAVAGQVLTVFARTVTIFFQHAADKYAEDANFKMLDIWRLAACDTSWTWSVTGRPDTPTHGKAWMLSARWSRDPFWRRGRPAWRCSPRWR